MGDQALTNIRSGPPRIPLFAPVAVMIFGVVIAGYTVLFVVTGGFGAVQLRKEWCESHGYALERAALNPKVCIDANRRLIRPPM